MGETGARINFKEFVAEYYPSYTQDEANEDVRTYARKLRSVLNLLEINPSNLKIGDSYSLTERNQKFLYELFSRYNSDKEFRKIRLHKTSYASSLINFVEKGFKEIMEDAGKEKSIIEQQIAAIKDSRSNLAYIELKEFIKELNKTGSFAKSLFDHQYNLDIMDVIFILKEMRSEYLEMIGPWEDKWKQLVFFMDDYRGYKSTERPSGTDEYNDYIRRAEIQNYIYEIVEFQCQELNDQIEELEKQEQKGKADLTQADKLNRLYAKLKKKQNDIKENVCKEFNIDPSELDPEKVLAGMKTSEQLYREALVEYNDYVIE